MILNVSSFASVFSVNTSWFTCETDLSDSIDLSHYPLFSILKLAVFGQCYKVENLPISILFFTCLFFVTAKRRHASDKIDQAPNVTTHPQIYTRNFSPVMLSIFSGTEARKFPSFKRRAAFASKSD